MPAKWSQRVEEEDEAIPQETLRLIQSLWNLLPSDEFRSMSDGQVRTFLQETTGELAFIGSSVSSASTEEKLLARSKTKDFVDTVTGMLSRRTRSSHAVFEGVQDMLNEFQVAFFFP